MPKLPFVINEEESNFFQEEINTIKELKRSIDEDSNITNKRLAFKLALEERYIFLQEIVKSFYAQLNKPNNPS